MKDAFKREIKVGDRVMYTNSWVGATSYIIGRVVKFHLKGQEYANRVEIEIERGSIQEQIALYTKNPRVYASNVVLLPIE